MNIENEGWLNEKIGKDFVNMLGVCGKTIQGTDDFDKRQRRAVKKFATQNYEMLSEKEKKYYTLAGYYALQCGLNMLNTLTNVKEKQKNGRT